jgi:hypothetical protein
MSTFLCVQVGVFIVIWSWPVSQLASDFDDDENMPAFLWLVHSTNLQHTLGVFFMGSLNFEVSSLIRKSAMSLILCPLHCERWRRTSLRQHRSTTAKATRCSFQGLSCNFSFVKECPLQGLDVILFPILIKSNPFSKKNCLLLFVQDLINQQEIGSTRHFLLVYTQ